jgi:hypothetical protein
MSDDDLTPYSGSATAGEEAMRRAESIAYGVERAEADVWTDERRDRFWTDELRARVRRDKDAVVLVTGKPGSGKSTWVMDRARKVDDTFTPATLPERVAFDPEGVVGLYRHTPRYGAAWIDEAVAAGLLATETHTADQIDLVTLVNVIRARNVILFVIVPNLSDLALSFRARRADYRVECDEIFEGMPATSHVGRKTGGRQFYRDDGTWHGFVDDPLANPVHVEDYRTSMDPACRALWDAYAPLKAAFLDTEVDDIARAMRRRHARFRAREAGEE